MSIIKLPTDHKHRIVNFESGEVIDSDSIPALRSIVKDWAISGIGSDMIVIRSHYPNVTDYLETVLIQWNSDNCEICDKWIKHKDKMYLEDNEGVCIAVGCQNCMS